MSVNQGMRMVNTSKNASKELKILRDLLSILVNQSKYLKNCK